MQHTPLHEEDVTRNAKMMTFHGRSLPLQFSGIVDEHLHTRSKVSLFDCSHMGEFEAKVFLLIQRQMGRYKIRTGIRSFDRQTPRAGHEVFCEGKPVGLVTGGGYGPRAGCGIGMAYVPLELSAPGTRLTIEPKDLEVDTGKLPFYKNGTFRM